MRKILFSICAALAFFGCSGLIAGNDGDLPPLGGSGSAYYDTYGSCTDYYDGYCYDDISQYECENYIGGYFVRNGECDYYYPSSSSSYYSSSSYSSSSYYNGYDGDDGYCVTGSSCYYMSYYDCYYYYGGYQVNTCPISSSSSRPSSSSSSMPSSSSSMPSSSSSYSSSSISSSSSSARSSSSLSLPSSSSSTPPPYITKGNSISNYRTVTIGTQVWMAENLDYNVAGSKCYDNQDSYCATYGRLYDWATAMALPSSCNTSFCSSQINAKHKGICPNGWHIPTYDEWSTLSIYVQSTSGCSSCDGRLLKAISGWNSGGANTYGFSALPGGSGYSDGSFNNVGYAGSWWSAPEYDINLAYRLSMGYNYEYAFWYGDDKTILRSVRCVMD